MPKPLKSLKVGSRVSFTVTIFSSAKPRRYGVVVERTRGAEQVRIKWDDGSVGWITDARYYWENGSLMLHA